MAIRKQLINVQDCPCDGCQAKPCGHPARCLKFAEWLNKTVDAVEVTRCKDCKSSRSLNDNERTYLVEECLICTNPEATNSGWNPVFPTHYCFYGERREDNATG